MPPILYALDNVHGSNYIYPEGTLFPQQLNVVRTTGWVDGWVAAVAAAAFNVCVRG